MAKETQLVNSGSFLEKRFHLKENHTNVIDYVLDLYLYFGGKSGDSVLNRNGFQGGTMGDGYLGSYRLHRNGPFD